MQKIGRALAGGDPLSIAKAVLCEGATRQHVLNRIVNEECV